MLTPGAAWSKLRWSLAQRGLAGTMQIALQRHRRSNPATTEKPPRHPFDLQHSVDTSGLIGGGDLGSGHGNDVYNTAYCGIAPSRFRRIVDMWVSDCTHPGIGSYSFIDVGCGKGRAVMMASEYPFRQTIGIELNASLAQIATRNLTIWESAGRPLCPARIVCQDATEFSFPQGPSVLYLYNPFATPVIRQLIASIQAQFSDRAGMLDLIYFNPQKENPFERHPSFKQTWTGIAPISDEDAAADLVASKEDICSIYRWSGPEQGSAFSF